MRSEHEASMKSQMKSFKSQKKNPALIIVRLIPLDGDKMAINSRVGESER